MEKSYRDLCEEIESLKQEAEAARKRESASALAEVKRLIAEYRFSAAECGFASAGVSKAGRDKAIVKIKYRHPENPSLTWTGRGKAPKWLVQQEAQGHRREDFLV